MPGGRPTDYLQETADTICERLVSGESLRAICRDEDMPAISTVFRWLSLHPEFSEQYARARDEQAETLADEIISIADECVVGEKVETDKDGNVVKTVTGDMIERSRLRVDARKWVAAKLKPRKYGDKVAVGGADDLPPVRHSVELTDEQLAAIAAGRG